MARRVLQVKGYSSEEIKALFNQEDSYKIGIKVYAVYQVSKEVSGRKLEEFYNTSFKQITTWVHNETVAKPQALRFFWLKVELTGFCFSLF